MRISLKSPRYLVSCGSTNAASISFFFFFPSWLDGQQPALAVRRHLRLLLLFLRSREGRVGWRFCSCFIGYSPTVVAAGASPEFSALTLLTDGQLQVGREEGLTRHSVCLFCLSRDGWIGRKAKRRKERMDAVIGILRVKQVRSIPQGRENECRFRSYLPCDEDDDA